MKLAVYNTNGNKTRRKADLEPSIFDIEPNDHVVWLDVRRLQAHARQGTAKTKERNEIRASGRKLYRQKGTGLSRAGDAKSPIRRTGGRAHGARPRDYKLNLNRETKRVARRSALTYKAREEALLIIEDFNFDTPSTRELRELVEALDLQDKKVLLLTAENAPEIYRSSRNMNKFDVQEARNASTYDLLNADVILLQEGGLEMVTRHLGRVSAEA